MARQGLNLLHCFMSLATPRMGWGMTPYGTGVASVPFFAALHIPDGTIRHQASRWSNRMGLRVRSQSYKIGIRDEDEDSLSASLNRKLSPLVLPSCGGARTRSSRLNPWPLTPKLSRNPLRNSDVFGQCLERTKTSGPSESPDVRASMLGIIRLRVD